MKKEIIIIGGGASGLFAAITAAQNGASIVMLDANDKAGKKILVTGNGRCNISNTSDLKDKYYCGDNSFLTSVFHHFSNKDVIEAFHKLGIAIKDKNGYLYPNSMQASAVVSALIGACQILGVKIINNCIVTKINQKSNGKFEIYAENGNIYSADKVLMAFGSRAGVKTDYTSHFFSNLTSLGHKINPISPALCSVYVKMQDKLYRSFFKNACGVRSEIGANLIIDNQNIVSYNGELQITDYGLSGIVIFQLSRMISRTLLNNKNAEIYINIDFLPEYSTNDVISLLQSQQFYQKKSVLDLFSGLLNQKLAMELLRLFSKVELFQKNISDDVLKNIIEFMKHTPFKIEKTNDYLHAQVCSGGIEISCINPDTMESKQVKNLYFCGECIDVDGICGGYNLQWAWSTGYIAGRSLSNDSIITNKITSKP